jgi:hypothetical protein
MCFETHDAKVVTIGLQSNFDKQDSFHRGIPYKREDFCPF